ncbi:MAG TPA: flagellar motor protein MotB [Baekduia sp.]|nr:flagellar motor protein MotB [Baekduia sp.]
MASRRRKRGGHHDDHGEHVDERWLLTYSDLITLLMALFMVLFSISSVNKSKFESLQHALQDAFSGRILPGGRSIKEAGGTDNISNPSPAAPQSNLEPYMGGHPREARSAAQAKEQQDFQKLKQQLDAVAAQKGLSGKIQTEVTPDGLHIRILTDDLLFDSGSATPRPQSRPLLDQMASLLGTQPDHQLVVQGNTDDVPIHGSQFPDNLALSTARAESIVRLFAADGITPKRMTAAGRGQYHPIADNSSPAGRSINRRVEILVPRAETSTDSSPIPSIRPDFSPSSSSSSG